MSSEHEIMALLAEARAARLGAAEAEATALRLEAQAQAILARAAADGEADEAGADTPCKHKNQTTVRSMHRTQVFCKDCGELLSHDEGGPATCPIA